MNKLLPGGVISVGAAAVPEIGTITGAIISETRSSTLDQKIRETEREREKAYCYKR